MQRWLVLRRCFELLNSNRIQFCVSHGHEGFPNDIGEDVDLIIPAEVTAQKLSSLFKSHQSQLQATVVRQHGRYFTLQTNETTEAPQLLALDFQSDVIINGRALRPASEILKTAVPVDSYKIPANVNECLIIVARAVSRGRMKPARATYLRQLFAQHRDACHASLLKIWQPSSVKTIEKAALSGNWDAMINTSSNLKSELDAFLQGQPTIAKPKANVVWRMVKRVITPPGFHIAFLGPDGAGKSSIIDVLERDMPQVFDSVYVAGFAPPFFRLWAKGPIKTDQPHSHKMRSYHVSLLRAAWWFVFQLCNHVILRVMKMQNMLVINDRYFHDILVDQIRYRYGGPIWALELVKMVTPSPDAFILLDGPAELIQARKKEVPVEVTAQQLREYRAVVTAEKNHHLVDVSQPLNTVLHDVFRIVLRR
jgi:thymidylate kinase